jgi:hypothetical protein
MGSLYKFGVDLDDWAWYYTPDQRLRQQNMRSKYDAFIRKDTPEGRSAMIQWHENLKLEIFGNNDKSTKPGA